LQDFFIIIEMHRIPDAFLL